MVCRNAIAERLFELTGHDIEQLRLVDPKDVRPVENTEDDRSRMEDVERYAGWLREGKTPPPAEPVKIADTTPTKSPKVGSGETGTEIACDGEAPSGMVCIPGGPFWRGADDGKPDEKPRNRALVSPFFLDTYEVTNDQYFRCVEAGRCDPPIKYYPLFAHAKQPVVAVSWYEAYDFCKFAGKRLPTEAEWEYAARSGSRRIFPWGSTAPSCTGVAFGRSPGGLCQGAEHTASVATMPLDVSPAPESVHDLGGNVAEWVMDWYLPTYPACIPPCRNPVVTAPDRTLPARVVRGGDAQGRAVDTRAARRAWLPPSDAKSNVGFRCAMDAPAH